MISYIITNTIDLINLQILLSLLLKYIVQKYMRTLLIFSNKVLKSSTVLTQAF